MKYHNIRDILCRNRKYRWRWLPDVPNYGKKGTGPILKEGMVIAVEPMLNLGTRKVCLLDDDWTIVTEDGKPSAHFEHTVLVLKDGYQILTKR